MRFLTFEAPAAKPLEESEQPVGRDIAVLLAQGVEARGFVLHEPVEAHDAYGWCFVASSADQRVWCMLQRSDQWLVIAKPQVPLLKRLIGKRGDAAAFRRLCDALDAAARGIPGVSGLRWFTDQEFRLHAQGTPSP